MAMADGDGCWRWLMAMAMADGFDLRPLTFDLSP